MNQEKRITPVSGYIILGIVAVLIIIALAVQHPVAITLVGIALLYLVRGLFTLNPNTGTVLVLFGDYQGTVKESGLWWVNPFYTRNAISLRSRNFDSDKIKVNDKVGNPIQISVILVWQVEDTYKATFEVDKYESFVKLQSDSAVRKLAGEYAYDNFDNEHEITLRSGNEEVNHALEENLRNRLDMAGIKIIEARIGSLSYAPEIAGAMLRRQQAAAVVSARFKIVEGAVSMVQMALDNLASQRIVELDEERKAAMVSNLMVVLCSDKDVNPVVNAGTLNH